MKRLIRSIPGVRPVIDRYRRWQRDPARNLRRIFKGHRDLFLVQIGSNDGQTGDPVYGLLRANPTWHALLVEPVPYLHERLRDNYRGNPNVRFEQVAVADVAGTSTFYQIDGAAKQHLPDLPPWFDQLGSFDRGHIVRHFGDRLDRFIVSAQVPTIPLPQLLARNGVTNIDLLHIDTEGHDWVVLRQLDLGQFRPRVILFEHVHLGAEDKAAARRYVEPGYRVTDLGTDYLCRRR